MTRSEAIFRFETAQAGPVLVLGYPAKSITNDAEAEIERDWPKWKKQPGRTALVEEQLDEGGLGGRAVEGILPP